MFVIALLEGAGTVPPEKGRLKSRYVNAGVNRTGFVGGLIP